jgi:4-amino-4-deoxy-L-arabinose transferase-like glycosyltransferase
LLLHRRLALLALLFLATVVARVPLIGDPIDVRPDGAEYLGIARHFAWEGRWESDIKWHFTTNEPVRHNALGDRPPLYPLVASAAVRLSRDPVAQVYAARLLNACLAALAACLAWFLIAGEFGEDTAWLAVLLFSLLPQNLRYSAQPLSESLFLVLFTGALLAWRKADRTASLASATGAGFLLGLGAMTHAIGLVAFGVLFPAAWLRRGGRRWRLPLWLAAGFVMAAGPYWIALWLTYGSPFYSVLRLNFSVPYIYDAIYGGYERTLPSPGVFISSHATLVARLIGRQAMTIFSPLGDTLLYLLPLALLLRRRDLAGRRGLYLILPLALAVAHSLAWVTWGAARYLLPADLLLFPVLLHAPLARMREEREGSCPAVSPRRLAVVLGLILLIALVQIAADLQRGAAGPRPLLEARWPWLALPTAGALVVVAGWFWGRLTPRPPLHRLRGEGEKARWRTRAGILNPGLPPSTKSVERGPGGEARPQPHSPSLSLYSALLAAAVALTAASEARLTVRLYREKASADRGFPDTPLKRAALAWLREHGRPGALVATDEPWFVNVLAEHPAVVLPWLRDAAQARRFLQEFGPEYVIVLVARAPGQPFEEAQVARRLFGPQPAPGPVPDLQPLRWRIEEVARGPRPDDMLLILAREGIAHPAVRSTNR